jgi:hypothetical protein
VMIWDDHQGKCIGELSFRSQVRRLRGGWSSWPAALAHAGTPRAPPPPLPPNIPARPRRCAPCGCGATASWWRWSTRCWSTTSRTSSCCTR